MSTPTSQAFERGPMNATRRLKTLRVRAERLSGDREQTKEMLSRAEFDASSPRKQKLMLEGVARFMASFAYQNRNNQTEEELARYFAVFCSDPKKWAWDIGRQWVPSSEAPNPKKDAQAPTPPRRTEMR